MRIPRSQIVGEHSQVHVVWRCHNQSMLLRPNKIKDLILKLYYEQTPRFGIRIIDHQLLDNHVHFILKTPNAKALGDFSRKVHTKIAIFINTHFGRDSQVFKDRFISPMINCTTYFINAIQYVWLNRMKVNPRLRPENDPYCSAYHRLRKTKYGKQLMSYSEAGLCKEGEEEFFFKNLLAKCVQNFKEKVLSLAQETFENRYLVGPKKPLERMRQRVLRKMKEIKALKK